MQEQKRQELERLEILYERHVGDQRELEARRGAAALKRAIEVQKFRELRLFEVSLLAEETMMSCTELRELLAEVALRVTACPRDTTRQGNETMF